MIEQTGCNGQSWSAENTAAVLDNGGSLERAVLLSLHTHICSSTPDACPFVPRKELHKRLEHRAYGAQGFCARVRVRSLLFSCCTTFSCIASGEYHRRRPEAVIMISLGRSSVGITQRRTASPLAIHQQLHAVASAGNAKSSLKRGRVISAVAEKNPPISMRTLVSVPAAPPRRLMAAPTPIRARSSSSALVPEKLVTVVPWVPVPLQPFMDKLHPVMIKERRPLAFLGMNTATNIGALCGHASFAILTAAYLETDVLTLR